jgi:hypothetical protein
MKKLIAFLIGVTMLFCVPFLCGAENGPVVPGKEDGSPVGYWAKHYESKGLYGMDVRAEKHKYYDGQFFFILIFSDDEENYGNKYMSVTDNDYNYLSGDAGIWNSARGYPIGMSRSQALQVRFMVETLCDEAPWELRKYEEE